MIIRDQPYNLLNLTELDATAEISLPFLDLRALCAPLQQHVGETLYRGNSVFELANLLQLLPGQSNNHLIHVERVALAQLVVDDQGYYARVSQEGVVRLACQYFHSVFEKNDTLFVRTTVGTFQFTRSDIGSVVHFSARERADICVAPLHQEFYSVQQCALGKFCVQESLNTDLSHNGSSPAGQSQWVAVKPHDAVALQNLTHTSCIRFLSPKDYDLYQLEQVFAEATISEAIDHLQKRPKLFDDYTKEGLGLIKVMSKKALRGAEHLNMSVTTAKWVLGGLARMPTDQLGPTDSTAAESAPGADSGKGVDNMTEDFEAFVLSQHAKKAEIDSPVATRGGSLPLTSGN